MYDLKVWFGLRNHDHDRDFTASVELNVPGLTTAILAGCGDTNIESLHEQKNCSHSSQIIHLEFKYSLSNLKWETF